MYKDLVAAACTAMNASYSPYSGFKVGAALLANDGRIYTGANIENASYPASICAERVAFAKALSDGVRGFSAIAVVSSDGKACPPCGVCLQFMSEFVDHNFAIVLLNPDSLAIYTLAQLLPMGFKMGK